MGQKPSRDIAPFAQAVNAELRARTAYHGLNQARVAEHTGIAQPTLSKMLYSETRPLTVHDLKLICEAIGEDPASILAAANKAIHANTYKLAAKPDTPDIEEADYL